MINNWGLNSKLEFNASKTKAILFTNKRNYRNPKIEMNGTRIEIVNELKYLGIVLDKKLKFNKHLDYIYDKCVRKNQRLSIISRNTWGLGSETLSLIYKAAIEPIVLYCSPIWAEKLNKTKIKKFRKMQRLIAMRITKAYRTISYESVIVIAGLIPIDIKIKESINISNIKSNKNGIINGLNCDYMERNIDHKLLPHPAKSAPIIIKNSYNNSDYKLKIFTDGSKSNTKVGSAFV